MSNLVRSGARPDWVQDSIFYQIFPDRFRNGDPTNDPPGVEPWGSRPGLANFMGGDLTGIRDGLSYLRDLGVTGLYLTPIFEAGTNHRYDTRDYLRIDPVLGDAGLLRDMVAGAHALGIRVLLDGVFNHCGDGFGPFRDLMEHGEQSRYRNWFFPRSFPIDQHPPNYQTCGGAGFLPKLNTADPDLRSYLLAVATHWIEAAGIDGWRLDVPWKADRSFWDAFRATVKQRKPESYLVGEIWRDGRPWQEPFDGVMNYPLRDYLLSFCVHDSMDAEDFRFETDPLFARPEANWQFNLLGSHDTPRLLTVCNGDVRRAMLALVGLFVMPGAPMLYYGDEIGLLGENDPDCRGCMIWDRSTWNRPIHDLCRRLIALRRECAALRRGAWEPVLTFNGVLVVRRRHVDGDVIVVMNPRDRRCNFEIEVDDPDGIWEERLGGGMFQLAQGVLRLPELPACSALLLTRPEGA